MEKISKILFFVIFALAILTFVYIYLPAPSLAKEPDCKWGWNSSPGAPCDWDYASNCVECTY
jgi:hypothetical protein